MTRALYLLDPAPHPVWAPFAGARPLAELRAGAHLVRERWERFAGAGTRASFGLPHLAAFTEADVPPVHPRAPVVGPALIGSATFAPLGAAPPLPEGAFRLVAGGVTVGWGVGAGQRWEGPEPAEAVEVPGIVLHGVFDLIRHLEPLLHHDTTALLQAGRGGIPRGAVVLGDADQLLVQDPEAIEPGVVFDTRPGPVVLARGVEVRSGTRLEGPLWVGPDVRLLGGPIRASAIGPRCVVRGEVACAVFLGFANKAHEGFVGHSVIGRWANLGAGTTTSNLKNTYGVVRLDVGATRIDTGLMNLGSLIGDHVKSAIGTLFGTGTVVGTGAHVFDAVRPPRYIPPFAWGGAGDARISREGFLKVAARALPRRHVPFDEATAASLGRIYDWAVR